MEIVMTIIGKVKYYLGVYMIDKAVLYGSKLIPSLVGCTVCVEGERKIFFKIKNWKLIHERRETEKERN